MRPTLEYDSESNAAYMRFSDESVLESEEVSDGVVLDFDLEGRIVGMEFMDARRHLSASMLGEAA